MIHIWYWARLIDLFIVLGIGTEANIKCMSDGLNHWIHSTTDRPPMSKSNLWMAIDRPYWKLTSSPEYHTRTWFYQTGSRLKPRFYQFSNCSKIGNIAAACLVGILWQLSLIRVRSLPPWKLFKVAPTLWNKVQLYFNDESAKNNSWSIVVITLAFIYYI